MFFFCFQQLKCGKGEVLTGLSSRTERPEEITHLRTEIDSDCTTRTDHPRLFTLKRHHKKNRQKSINSRSLLIQARSNPNLSISRLYSGCVNLGDVLSIQMLLAGGDLYGLARRPSVATQTLTESEEAQSHIKSNVQHPFQILARSYRSSR